MTQIPERLRSVRLAKGLTLEAVAFAAGLSVSTVQRIETGKHSPSLDTLSAICGALDTTAAALLSEPVGERAS